MEAKGKVCIASRCSQCGNGFLSSYSFGGTDSGRSYAAMKSLNYTIDYDIQCTACGNKGVIYSKNNACLFFGLGNKDGEEK